jgi:hypothetical protein
MAKVATLQRIAARRRISEQDMWGADSQSIAGDHEGDATDDHHPPPLAVFPTTGCLRVGSPGLIAL